MLQNQFVRMGISVIPIQWQRKEPDANMLPIIDGRPRWEVFKSYLTTPELTSAWFTTGRKCNWAVVAGWQDTVILDFDNSIEYNRWLLWAARVRGVPLFVAQSAFKVQSSRGVHVYIRIPGGGSNRKAGAIDIKFRGYVLGPGSIHPSGAEYVALSDRLFFPQVQKLSDVLPASLLESAEFRDHPDTIPAPIAPPLRGKETDPWASAWDAGAPTLKTSAIEAIKKVVKIESYFTELHDTGSGFFVTRCPFHDDSKPSFWVSTERQICNCFTCQFSKPMDVIDLHARLYGLSNAEAIRALVRM